MSDGLDDEVNYMTKTAFFAGAAALATMASPAAAVEAVFFGENLNPGGAVSGDPATAEASFLAQLTAGVSTEDFESFTPVVSPSSLTFQGSAGTISASLSGPGGEVRGIPGSGRFATSGSNYFNISGDFQIDFSNAIAAFGFFGTDIGDFDGQVTLELLRLGQLPEVVVIPNTIGAPNASLLYFGVIDTANPFTGLRFGNTAAGSDSFGFDNLTIGDVGQVTGAVPEPSTWALMLLGFFGIGAVMRRRKDVTTTVSYA
ncbi:MAG: PEPxxWA-CTERM sorting domain-containing protein [Erythrobacter sp.]|nr:PEPxxWA-CTERM sorting domain-containing protein [Erythrobacter sp.]